MYLPIASVSVQTCLWTFKSERGVKILLKVSPVWKISGRSFDFLDIHNACNYLKRHGPDYAHDRGTPPRNPSLWLPVSFQGSCKECAPRLAHASNVVQSVVTHVLALPGF